MSTEERNRLMGEGRAAFNRGDFFLAHELWEEVWLSCTGPERRWIQGLIQVAAALHHLAQGRPAAAAGLLARALVKLDGAPARLDGIDVPSCRGGAERLLATLRRGEPADPRALVLR